RSDCPLELGAGRGNMRSYAPKYNIHLASHPISIHTIMAYGGRTFDEIADGNCASICSPSEYCEIPKDFGNVSDCRRASLFERRLAEEQAGLQQFAWNIAPEGQ